MTYDYICTACGHVWEADQRITEPALTECPSCRGQTAKRQVSGGSGFILRGGGWYSDLYSSAKPARTATEPSQKAGGEGSNPSGTSCPAGACGTSSCPAAAAQ